ncbi:MAG: hypothetical protein IT380_24755 [Myxococcales bacterium]|nr:hypothetical protein [Myxococcales bacterium]
MTTRAFSFFRAGGFEQVRFDSGKDLLALEHLDQKLWVALACPTKGLAFDARTLELIDTEKDGRIRAKELIEAVKWTGTLLKNPDDLLKGADALPLSAIDDTTSEGKRIIEAAKTVLVGLKKPDGSSIAVADTADASKAFHAQPFNGDGVVTAASAGSDETAKALLADVIACVGSVEDKSGQPGINEDKVKAFFADVAAYVPWLQKAEADASLLPLKADTAAAFDSLKAVRTKVDDYFARCRLAAFDSRAAAALNREEKEYLALAAKDLTITADEVKAFPLARIAADAPLPLDKGLNPAWAGAMATFSAKVVTPLLGAKSALTEAEWAQLTAKFSAHEAWLGTKAGASVEKLGGERLKALAKDGARAPLDVLFAKEKECEPAAQAIASVERLVRFVRDLHRLANNFVSFREFYQRKGPAIFQVGTLYLDQRAAELCVRVDDAGKHATMAPLSRACLVYCDCARPATGEKMTIVAAMTDGDSDNLMVGRNGVFYDRDGKDWDATVTKLVDNPISIRQAFWSPYKKLVRFVEEQVAKRAAAAEEASHKDVLGKAVAVDKSADSGKSEVAPKKLDIGVVAALGVAVGGITAALGALLQAFFGLGLWMPLGFVGLLLLISGPSMLVAWLKLRQRNIGPLLDANGWAVNARALLNVPFGRSLTKVAALPRGSHVDTVDPFAEKKRPWKLYLALLVLLGLAVGYYLGKLDGWLPPAARSTAVLKDIAPATEAPAPTPEPDAPKAK